MGAAQTFLSPLYVRLPIANPIRDLTILSFFHHVRLSTTIVTARERKKREVFSVTVARPYLVVKLFLIPD
jgi:hypothetical protein